LREVRTAAARKSARPQKSLCARPLQHRPEAHVMRNGEGRQGAELQRAIGDRHAARSGGERGSHHRCHRLSPTGSRSRTLRTEIRSCTSADRCRWLITPIMRRCRRPHARRGFLRFVARELEAHRARTRRVAAPLSLSSAVPYDARRMFSAARREKRCAIRAVLNRGHGVRTRVYRAPKESLPHCALREQLRTAGSAAPPGGARSRVPRRPSATTAFKAKMQTEEGRQIYARGSQIAEFAHAWIKERCGLRQFRCRGRLKPPWKPLGLA